MLSYIKWRIIREMLVTDVKIFGEVPTNREKMCKLNLIFLCGMCIFPIFIGGIPLINDFKQAPATEAENFSSAGHEKTASDDSKFEIKYIGDLPKEIGTFSLAIVKVQNQINTQNHNVQQIAASDNFTNSKEDISVDAQQESIFYKQGPVLEHSYRSRSVDDDGEDYTEVPVFGFNWEKPNATKQKISHHVEDPTVSEIVSTASTKPKRRTKIHGGRKSYSFDHADTSVKRKVISNETFGDKLFLFKKEKDFDPTASSTMKGTDDGKNSLFLFNNELPNPSEKLNSKRSFYL